MSNKLFASKTVRKAIMKAMTSSQRRWMKEGEIFYVRIIRTSSKTLKRWGADNNTAKIAVGGKCCRIYRNNLVDFAWNNNIEEAAKEAANAINYFVFGDEDEYKIIIERDVKPINFNEYYKFLEPGMVANEISCCILSIIKMPIRKGFIAPIITFDQYKD